MDNHQSEPQDIEPITFNGIANLIQKKLSEYIKTSILLSSASISAETRLVSARKASRTFRERLRAAQLRQMLLLKRQSIMLTSTCMMAM